MVGPAFKWLLIIGMEGLVSTQVGTSDQIDELSEFSNCWSLKINCEALVILFDSNLYLRGVVSPNDRHTEQTEAIDVLIVKNFSLLSFILKERKRHTDIRNFT